MNLKYGVRGPETRTGTETETCTACAGTIILEFAALSRFTGDPVFEVSDYITRFIVCMEYRFQMSDHVTSILNRETESFSQYMLKRKGLLDEVSCSQHIPFI